MSVNIPGLVSVIVFYILIIVIGIIGGRKTVRSTNAEEIFVANRSIGVWLSYFTLTATNIGGGYINGTAEAMAFSGLVWTNAPIIYAISIAVGAFLYAPKMRRGGYVTMFDPIQMKLGNRAGSLLFFPQLMGDIFWTASILSALGSTVSIILDIDPVLSIIVSACVAVFYTFIGGLYSVAYTDVIQLICLSVGLAIIQRLMEHVRRRMTLAVASIWDIPTAFSRCSNVNLLIFLPYHAINRVVSNANGNLRRFYIRQRSFVVFPFAFYHPSVDLSRIQDTWMGQLPTSSIGAYVDVCCQLLLGGLPWQAFYQRVLACKTPNIARNSALMASVSSLILAIPPAAIGVVGAAADWNATSYDGPIPIPKEQHSFILPMVIHYLCPVPVAVIGIGVVAAAVMSSADSAVLATGTVFAKNIWKDVFRSQASDRELIWVMRISTVVVGALACVLAIMVKTVYGLFYLCTDLMYVILFPQLTCVLWLKAINTYGSITAFFVCLFLRVAAGDTLLGIAPLIRFPFYSETEGQGFPFRTLTMLINFLLLASVSMLTNLMFRREWLPLKFDIFNVIQREDERIMAEERGEGLMMRERQVDDAGDEKAKLRETFT